MWDIHQHGAECLLGFWGGGSCIQGSSSDGGADSREIRKGEVTRGGRVSGAVAVLGGGLSWHGCWDEDLCVAAGTIAAQVREFCSCRGWKGPQVTGFNLTAKAGPAVGGCPNGSGVSP